ncbi:MAG: hypothetical protein HOU81_26865 [Hamadaea sp.]|uniref:hypothetical protein n=1 Tax=Hamadaea sp. TaxID=2024425 RepID=UPI0017FEC88B|nr:hypothetical protein [Hamadaea sp.]NUR74449.1 hypothetical protein [Hamadaea sp.]NUT18957.1 hypothetical protein [Hamadaea sp.]
MIAPSRPGILLYALYLYWGAAALWLTSAIGALFAIPQYRVYYADLHQDPRGGSLPALLLAGVAVVASTGGAVIVLCTVLDAYGWPIARWLTWTYSVFAAAIAGIVLLVNSRAVIPWHRWSITVTAVLSLFAVAGGSILLAQPASGRFFSDCQARRRGAARQRAVAWQQRRMMARSR